MKPNRRITTIEGLHAVFTPELVIAIDALNEAPMFVEASYVGAPTIVVHLIQKDLVIQLLGNEVVRRSEVQFDGMAKFECIYHKENEKIIPFLIRKRFDFANRVALNMERLFIEQEKHKRELEKAQFELELNGLLVRYHSAFQGVLDGLNSLPVVAEPFTKVSFEVPAATVKHYEKILHIFQIEYLFEHTEFAPLFIPLHRDWMFNAAPSATAFGTTLTFMRMPAKLQEYFPDVIAQYSHMARKKVVGDRWYDSDKNPIVASNNEAFYLIGNYYPPFDYAHTFTARSLPELADAVLDIRATQNKKNRRGIKDFYRVLYTMPISVLEELHQAKLMRLGTVGPRSVLGVDHG